MEEPARKRWPRGYVGRDHVTIGSDIAAVLGSLELLVAGDDTSGPRSGDLVERILGADELARLRAIKLDAWYPIGWLLDLMEKIDRRIGRYGLLRMGRLLFRMSHEARVKEVATCGRDIVYGIDAMYHHANRGEDIGGWRVVAFDDRRAELEKTTPHHCAMEEGILAQALAAVGARAVVGQTECFREGAPLCRFVIQSGGGIWAPKDVK